MANTWAFNVVMFDGIDTYGFKSKKAAEAAREEIRTEFGQDVASKVMESVPGDTHWVIHVNMKDGTMKSLGFGSQTEAMKFHQMILDTVENADLASMPTEAKLKR